MFARRGNERAGKPFRALTTGFPAGSATASSGRTAHGDLFALALPALLGLAAIALASCASPAQGPPEAKGGRKGPLPAGAPRTSTPAVASPKVSPLENSLAPFVPSPPQVVRQMLDLAQVTEDDVVYDLGSGDGRIVVEAAKLYGARAVGIDYDLRLCEEARERADREGVAHLVEIRHEDVLEADFSDATVVTLYLLPASNARLRPKLSALRPGTRIVAHNYGIDGWNPVTTAVVETRDYEKHLILLFEVGR